MSSLALFSTWSCLFAVVPIFTAVINRETMIEVKSNSEHGKSRLKEETRDSVYQFLDAYTVPWETRL